ncbi:RagB/SusD family nutrient uptake outer membrane protein [Flavihumibacter solisilvae]|uniref:Glycan metabolism protein RagB n=1 Tax=Flavihumibacter solisilvae TaxID=1349421 RepID=A0A0C1IWF7_9BACT|nr:RagB/SusD family nutrient uptake outer membrane protein [Flavihumibacter solisilvae]KIC94829.1 glycan metabolism protein RagB [Flavihumibacter solisilvae]
MKKIRFNYITSTLLGTAAVTVLLVANGCTKSFLDVPPQGQQPNEAFWQNEDDAAKAVNAMYANLRTWNNVAFAPIAIESLGSDDTEKGSSASDATFLNKFDDFTATSTEGQTLDFWAGQFQNINLANQVLANVPPIAMEEGLKNRFLAEAKFIRAYSYFRLVRAFGGVPLRLKLPVDASEYNIPRATKEEVYAAIEQDLTEAAAVLPQTYPSKDIGRATKGAALALHAKVSMYQNKWDQVLNLTNQVMGLGYALFPDYEKLFRVQNENSVESVFEIQAAYVPGNCDISNSQYSQVQGVRASFGGGWGFNVPTQDLANAYEADDPRRDATIIFRGETTPQGDPIPATGDNPMYNQKSYVPFSTYVECSEGSEQNIRVIRYADVLLMNAEAANELGNPAQAKSSLNAVRARARGGNAAILPDVTTDDQGALREAIWKERRVELAMEFDRFFDLVRQGRAATVLAGKGFVAGKNEVWPIPQNEIDLSAGTLTQNPGY